MTTLAILKNNQERENEAETPVIQTVLPEAMLIAGVMALPDISQPARLHLLVCDIPADKTRSGTQSKLPKSEENKGKSKSVSYSTQLSFESEDEYFDPLFSVPSVFQSINNPMKDGFSKSVGEKSEEKQVVRNAKVVQCLSIDDVHCDNLQVSQVLSYDDGKHVLLVLTKIRQNCNPEIFADSQCLNKNNHSEVGDKVDNDNICSGDGDEGHDKVCDSSVLSDSLSREGSSLSSTIENSHDKRESIGHKESRTSLKNSSLEPSQEENNSSCNTKYPKENSDLAEPSADENVTSNLDLLDNTDNKPTEKSSESDTMKYPELSNVIHNSTESSPNENTSQSKPESIHAETVTPNCGQDSKDSIFKNSETSPKVLPTEHTCSSMYERKYSSCLLLYKTRTEKGRTLLEDKPCKTMFTSSSDSLCDVFLLPNDAEDSFMPSLVEVNDHKNIYLAGTLLLSVPPIFHSISLLSSKIPPARSTTFKPVRSLYVEG